ncbi:MAG: peptidylprolyl isomerase, partial [Bacteroidales bacterium]|nr:peptidylprolyl isomerase [Bacteroidales bacterium]
GDPDSKNAPAGKQLGQGGPGYTIQAEFNKNLIHKKGALAAARLGDQMNPQRKSSGSQFYIVQGKKMSIAEMNQMAQYTGINYSQEQMNIYQSLGGTPFLDGQYTVFGEIVQGLEVIDKIAAVEKDRSDRPLKDVKMTIKLVD